MKSKLLYATVFLFMGPQLLSAQEVIDENLQANIYDWASQGGRTVLAEYKPLGKSYLWIFVYPSDNGIVDITKNEGAFSDNKIYDYSLIKCNFEVLYIPMVSNVAIAMSEDDFTPSGMMFDMFTKEGQMQASAIVGGYASKRILKIDYDQKEINLSPGRTIASNSTGYMKDGREKRYKSREDAEKAALHECETDSSDRLGFQAPDSMGNFFLDGVDEKLNFRDHSRVTLFSKKLEN